jgi:hypothetical protein
MGVFDWTYNTVKGVGAEMGGIIGIKGGADWMREKYGVAGPGAAMGRFGSAFKQGGFMGMVGHGKRFFGVGFDPTAKLHEMMPYMKTIQGQGMRSAYSMAGFTGTPRTFGEIRRGAVKIRQVAGGAQAMFGRRRIAGGVAGAAGLAAVGSTIGLGNALTLGAGVGLGVAGGRYFARAGARDISMWGRRGGKLGFAAAGIGLMTGMI